MDDYLNQLLETVEDAKLRIEEAVIEQEVNDVDDLLDIMTELVDELERRRIDGEEE